MLNNHRLLSVLKHSRSASLVHPSRDVRAMSPVSSLLPVKVFGSVVCLQFLIGEFAGGFERLIELNDFLFKLRCFLAVFCVCFDLLNFLFLVAYPACYLDRLSVEINVILHLSDLRFSVRQCPALHLALEVTSHLSIRR